MYVLYQLNDETTRVPHRNPRHVTLCTQVRIQDLVKGGAPASEAESCRHSEAESRK